jgi:hypothetical protein
MQETLVPNFMKFRQTVLVVTRWQADGKVAVRTDVASIWDLLGVCKKLRKGEYQLRLVDRSICLSVRVEQLGSQ